MGISESGGGGNGTTRGGFAFSPSHVFDDNAARDAYFDAPDPHLDELINQNNLQTLILSGTEFQRWTGTNQPTTYDNTDWEVFQDAALAMALTGIDDNRFVIKTGGSNGTLSQASMRESATQIIAEKEVVSTPTSFVWGETGARLTSAGQALILEGTNDGEYFLIQNAYNAVGGSAILERSRMVARAEYTIQSVKTTNSAVDPTFEYTISAVGTPTENRRHTDQLTIESPDSGTITAVLREGGAMGRLLRTESATVTADTETAIDLVQPICLDIGTIVHVTITGGLRLKGDIIATEFQPFLKVRSYLGYNDQIATAATMDDLSTEIRDALHTLSGNNRLLRSAIYEPIVNITTDAYEISASDNGKVLLVNRAVGTATTISIPLGIESDVSFFDLFNQGLGSLTLRGKVGEDVRINDETDLVFSQHEGGRVSKTLTAGRWGVLFEQVSAGQDNYVDTMSFDDPTRVLTLGRTGTLPDLTETIPAGTAGILDTVNTYTDSPTQNVGIDITGHLSILSSTTTGFDFLAGTTLTEDGIFAIHKQGSSTAEFDISAVAYQFSGTGVTDVNAYDIEGDQTILFYTKGTTIYPISEIGDISAAMSHPIVLTRDTPSKTDLATLAAASLNGNSATWILANDQITTSDDNIDDTVMIRALKTGFLDINNDQLSTTAVQKNSVKLQGGTIVRVFSDVDLRIVSTPTVTQAAQMYPDTPITGGSPLNLVGSSVLYTLYRNRTLVLQQSTGTFSVYLWSLQNELDRGFLIYTDVFSFRNDSPNDAVFRIRTFQVGTVFSSNTLTTIDLQPGQILRIRPIMWQGSGNLAVWEVLAQGQSSTIELEPVNPTYWYKTDNNILATDNPVRINNQFDLVDGLVRDHIRSAGYTNNPISLIYQKKNYQDDIAWIQSAETLFDVSGLTPLGTRIDEILYNIPIILGEIETNFNAGHDFDFNAPEGTDGIESIGFVSGNTIRYTMDNVIPAIVTLNHEVVFANCTNAVNNGTYAVTFIDASNRIIHITNPARSDGTDDEPTSPGYMDVPIYCDAVVVSHDLRQVNFNCYEDSARTSLVTPNPNWFNPDYSGGESVLAIGYNNDVETVAGFIAIEDDNGDYFSSLGGPRSDIFFFDNTGGEYQNTRYLPINRSYIQIKTLGICNFYFDIHPDDLPIGQRRVFGVKSDIGNDNNDVTIAFGRAGAGNNITFDEGVEGVDLLNGERQFFEIYNDGDTSGVRIASSFQKNSPSFTLNESGTSVTAGLLPMSQVELIVGENEDPNFRFAVISSNQWEMLGTFTYVVEYSCEIVFNGNEITSGIGGVTCRIDPQRDRSSTITNYENVEGSRSGTLYFTRNGDNTDDGTRPYINLTAKVRISRPNVNDKVQFNLSFGDFPAGYSASDLLLRNNHFSLTVQGGLR